MKLDANPAQPDQEKTNSIDESPPQRICLKHTGHYESECPRPSLETIDKDVGTPPDQALVAAWMESMGFKWLGHIWSNSGLKLTLLPVQATFFYQAHVAAVVEAEERGAQLENEIWTRLAVKYQWGDIMHARNNLNIYLNQEEFVLTPSKQEGTE